MLDDIDSRLLTALQKDARLTVQELGALLNLSPSQAGRRKQRLEQSGVIAGYTARLAPERLGLNIQAFVQVEMASQRPEEAESFARLIRIQPEIVSTWTLTGDADFLLRVYCRDLTALNHLIHKVLLTHGAVAKVRSQIVMNQLKADAPLPT